MSRPRHVSILIPARDEEELLPQCLDSVHQAVAKLPAGISYDLIVAVDQSTDRTWDIAVEKVGAVGAVVKTDAGVVGRVRSLAADTALQRYSGPLALCWLANTDADCIVPPHWLNNQILLAAEGYDAIAGTIDVIDFREHEPSVEQRFRETYLIPADGSHPHVHGANLSIRANVYKRAGGWKHLETGEDHDLWSRVSAAGARTLSVNHTRVITSGRRVGRAPRGFADALAAHNEKVA